MELTEMQNIWIQHDEKINENTRLNKEILKKFIISKTENKINWIKLQAIFNLLIPIPMVIYIAIDVEYRPETDFYIGLFMWGICFILTYFWAIKYYLLADKIDFLKPVTAIKKDINKLKHFKLKTTRIGYMIAPFFITGIFLFVDIPFLSKRMIPVYSLILLVAAISAYFTYKFGVLERLKKINREIDEIEKLES